MQEDALVHVRHDLVDRHVYIDEAHVHWSLLPDSVCAILPMKVAVLNGRVWQQVAHVTSSHQACRHSYHGLLVDAGVEPAVEKQHCVWRVHSLVTGLQDTCVNM